MIEALMVQKRRSIDGFVPRRTDNILPNEVVINDEQVTFVPEPVTPQPSMPVVDTNYFPQPISDEPKPTKRRRKPITRRRRIIKWIIIGFIVLLLGVGGWLAYRFYTAAGNVFKGNALEILLAPEKPLKTDQYGNTNVLLLGTSESDPGHPGAQLTDSMMVASVNRTTHQVFLLSVSRDLWVTYDSPCEAGYSGKINAVYECALGKQYGGLSHDTNDETTAENLTAEKVGSVLGLDLQYTVHMNLAVIQQVVDAVGGIDITIESPDPRGILDRNFDWRCHYQCYLVKYPNGPAHLNGTDAMWLAQARNDAGGYGLPRSNFDREDNQRKIVMATKDKATSIGFLANPINVVNLLDALGNNIHTTIDSSEVKTFVSVTKETPTQNIASIDVLNDAPGVLTTATGPDGSSIVRPKAGLENYTDLQAFVKKLLQGQAPIIAESAPVDVLNASGTAGLAQQLADDLSSNGVIINQISNIAQGTYPHYTIYDLSKGSKPKTLDALKAKLAGATVETTLPKGIVSSSAQFVVVIGASGSSTSSAQ